MRQKLRTETGHGLYRMRKAIVEPVLGSCPIVLADSLLAAAAALRGYFLS